MSGRPRVYKTEAIVLRRRNVGEADSIFTLLFPREGKFDAVARGVRKARSHMRGHLEPLTRSRVMLAQGRSLDVLTQAETIAPYLVVRGDLERSAAALYGAELIDRFVGEREAAQEAFALFSLTLDALEGGLSCNVLRWFEVQLLGLSGYEFQVETCAVCSKRLTAQDTLLCPGAGGLVCEGCRAGAGPARLLSLRAIKVLRYARSATIDQFASVNCDEMLERELRSALADLVREVTEVDTRAGRFVDDVASLPAHVPSPPLDRDSVYNEAIQS